MIIIERKYHEVRMEGDTYARVRPYNWYYCHRNDPDWESIPYAECVLLEEEFNDRQAENSNQ